MYKQSLMLVAVAAVVASCGGAGLLDNTDAPDEGASPDATGAPDDDALGGFGSPAQAEGEFQLGPGGPTTGTLQLEDNGCWSAVLGEATYLAVLPIGFEIPSSDATTLVGPDGTEFASGDAIDGMAHDLPIQELPGGSDGRWGNYVSFCSPDARSVVVFEQLGPAADPLALTEDELAELVTGATFPTAWPCGRGWAMSTEDEVVGLFVYQQTSDRLEAGATVALPDEGWLAQVTVGKHLFVNHCDDVFEPLEPLPVIAAEWPITGGVLEVVDSFPEGDEGAAVRAVLSGVQVQTPSGTTLDLGTIELDNRSFNFFAG